MHKINPERISKACPKLFCSNFLVVAFVSSWANLETNLGSHTPGNLQLQATVSSNISGFLARLQPLHLDHDYDRIKKHGQRDGTLERRHLLDTSSGQHEDQQHQKKVDKYRKLKKKIAKKTKKIAIFGSSFGCWTPAS